MQLNQFPISAFDVFPYTYFERIYLCTFFKQVKIKQRSVSTLRLLSVDKIAFTDCFSIMRVVKRGFGRKFGNTNNLSCRIHTSFSSTSLILVKVAGFLR